MNDIYMFAGILFLFVIICGGILIKYQTMTNDPVDPDNWYKESELTGWIPNKEDTGYSKTIK